LLAYIYASVREFVRRTGYVRRCDMQAAARCFRRGGRPLRPAVLARARAGGSTVARHVNCHTYVARVR
jgi:hypothetical protein